MLVDTRKSLLLLTPDGTTPTASDFIEVSEPILAAPVIGGGNYSRITGQKNTGNQRYNDLNNVTSTFTASVLMRTSNSAGTALNTAPQISPALQISGFDETIDTSTVGEETVTYSNSQSPVGGTAILYTDGQKFTFEASSVVANPTFTFTLGEPATVNFDMEGFLVSATPTAEANPTVTTSDEDIIVVSCIDLLTVGGNTIQADEVTLTANNEIQTFYTLGGANKLKSKEIGDNGYTLTASFFVDSATYGREYTELETQTLQAISLKLGLDNSSDLVNGTSIQIDCSKAETQEVSDDTKNERVYRTVTYRLNNDSVLGDDAIRMKYGFFA